MKSDKEVVLAALQENGKALGYASDEMKSDKQVLMAAVQLDDPYRIPDLRYACRSSPKVLKELMEEAQSYGMSVKEYARAAANPIIIQLFSSVGTECGGYGGASLMISCRDIAGNQVLAFSLGADAVNAEQLRSDLAEAKGVSPAAVQIINHRGEMLRRCPTVALQDFVALGK